MLCNGCFLIMKLIGYQRVCDELVCLLSQLHTQYNIKLNAGGESFLS
jgi:hypothetical protein